MADKSRLIPLATMEQILKKAGAPRVSEEAKKELKNALENYANKISIKAIELSKHAKRRTVLGEDVRLAARE
jgi:DNA-binding protein